MIPLVQACITDVDRTAVAAAVYSDALTSDRLLREYEEAFAARVGCAGAVAVCSGTEALRLAYLVTSTRSEMSIPSYACSAITNAIRRPDFLVDSIFDVATAAMRQEPAELVVHMFGRPTIGSASRFEDYTLSLGAVPSLAGEVGVCSTHASKMLSTGRGGIVFSNDQALLDGVRALAYYDDEPNGRLGAYSLGMTSMQAALGLSQLRQLDAFIERRRWIAETYSHEFFLNGIEAPDPDCGSVFFRYLIAVDDPAAKVTALAEHGIEAGRGVYPPLHRQLGLSDDDFPGATWCVDHLLSVPCHPSLSDADVAFVAERVKEVCA